MHQGYFFCIMNGKNIMDSPYANENLSRCLFIESNEVSSETVMIRLQKDTYSRDFLWRVAKGQGRHQSHDPIYRVFIYHTQLFDGSNLYIREVLWYLKHISNGENPITMGTTIALAKIPAIFCLFISNSFVITIYSEKTRPSFAARQGALFN